MIIILGGTPAGAQSRGERTSREPIDVDDGAVDHQRTPAFDLVCALGDRIGQVAENALQLAQLPRREHTTWHLAHDGEHNLAHLVIQLPHERQQLAIPGYHAAALPDLTRCCASRAKITRTIRALAAITTTNTGLDMATTVVAIPPMGNDRRA